MPHVDLNEANDRHCRCPQCPVEQASQCSLARLTEVEKGEDPAVEDSPKVYCSHGKSTCSDMDGKYGCLCPSCLVWDENELANNHYCIKGNADEIN